MNIIIRSGRKKESSQSSQNYDHMINVKYLLLFSCSLHPINILKHFNFIAFTFSDLANANQKLLLHTLLIMYINFQVKTTFIPLDQETLSNIKYTGNGFIPEDFIKFHTNWDEIHNTDEQLQNKKYYVVRNVGWRARYKSLGI